MSKDFLDDEQLIADERALAEDQDILSLQQSIGNLPELHPVVSVGPEISISKAVETMVDEGVGCLLITDGGQLLGLFTERDVLRKVVVGAVDTATTPVSKLMTEHPDTLHIDSPLVFALHRMTVGGYRHVPLLNDDGQPVAVVSMRDIVEYIVSLYPHQVLNLPDKPHHAQWKGRDGA